MISTIFTIAVYLFLLYLVIAALTFGDIKLLVITALITWIVLYWFFK